MSPIDGDDKDIQYLLNAFVFFNVLQILAILGLAHLDKKQRQAAARRMNAILPQAVSDSDEEEPPSKKGSGSGDEDWQAEASTSDADTRRRRGSLSHHIRNASTATQQSIPLLGGGSRHSTVRGSRYLVEAAVAEDSTGAPVTVKIIRSKPEVRRGEFFALLSTLAIALAWVLFMGTAWYRLRSKEERGGGSHGNFTLH